MRLPKYDERTVIVGSTGSGKTALGLWLLSKRNFENRTTIIIDHKIDDNIKKIKCKHLDINSRIPDDGGFYVLYPNTLKVSVKQNHIIDEKLTDILWTIWERGNYLVYIDEGMMINSNCPALKALLTQGRSKNVEMIILTQRPVEVSRFIFSESDYLGLMRLNDPRDLDVIKKAFGVDLSAPMGEFHWRWLDRKKNTLTMLSPVPMPKQSVKEINLKLHGLVRAL